MERLLTKCCMSEVDEVMNEGGHDHQYCTGCHKVEPHLEWVEMCDHCERPGGLCECP